MIGYETDTGLSAPTHNSIDSIDNTRLVQPQYAYRTSRHHIRVSAQSRLETSTPKDVLQCAEQSMDYIVIEFCELF